MADWREYLAQHSEEHLAELKEFLSFPSVASLPEHAPDVAACAEWLAARLRRAGLDDVRVLSAGPSPLVYAAWQGAGDAPTVLIYGHFDVQPADPLEEWRTPPFEPQVREGRIYARGASDDKGNLYAPLLALEALLATTGRLPVNLKLLLEGEEEIGSPHLSQFIAGHRELLACDIVLSADGSQWSETEPALMVGFKGITGLQVDLTGPNADLHSGMFGGAVQNPIHALVELLAGMHAPDGRVLVEGFYDKVRPLGPEERASMARVPHDDAVYRRRLGVEELYGEEGYTTLERAWARPTLEVNGIWGGFTGAGSKTVLPSRAHAKLTCRLVADQTPDAVHELVAAHVRRHLPPGVTAEISRLAGKALPYLIPADHPANRLAAQVLEGLYGREPYQIRMGGSLPVCGAFLEELGIYTVNFAFGLEDEGLHSPNEFWRLASFQRAKEAYAELLELVGERGLQA